MTVGDAQLVLRAAIGTRPLDALLADNPMLARLKELELLQGILAGTKATFVFGPGDLAEQVRTLAGTQDGA